MFGNNIFPLRKPGGQLIPMSKMGGGDDGDQSTEEEDNYLMFSLRVMNEKFFSRFDFFKSSGENLDESWTHFNLPNYF